MARSASGMSRARRKLLNQKMGLAVLEEPVKKALEDAHQIAIALLEGCALWENA